MVRKITAFAVLSLLLLSALPAFCSDFEELKIKPHKQSQEIVLDADSITYNEHTGLASADGNVSVKNLDMTLRAPHIEYDSKNGDIIAISKDGSSREVSFISGENSYAGNRLEYNVETRRGTFFNVEGKSRAMNIKGSDVVFMPSEEALSNNLAGSKRISQKSVDNKDTVIQWQNVTATTCDYKKPHYYLQTKTVIIIPNSITILKQPRLYFGERFVFQYPFDYVIRPGRQTKIMPIVEYDTTKGVGLGANGSFYLNKWGILDAKLEYWTDNYFEADLRYEKKVTDAITFFAEGDRLYNKDDNEIKWRPKYGLEYDKNGWTARLYMAENELVSNEILQGVTNRFNVTKRPELSAYSPWVFKRFKPAKLRFGAMYGRYSDGTLPDWTKRTVGLVTMESNFENIKIANFFRPFYGARFAYFDYSDDLNSTQKVTDVWMGLEYKIGAFDLASRYYKRWADGESPLAFDKYLDKKVFYQSVAFPLPIGNKKEKWKFSATAEYDLELARMAVLYYELSYDKHCYTWTLWGQKQFYGDESKLGLTFFINAMSDSKLDIGSKYDVYEADKNRINRGIK